MNDADRRCIEAWEMLAESYAAHVDTKPHNAYYDRPALLSLLPDLDGRKVLDAGCGPGAYAVALLDGGAEVVGIDAAPTMITLARNRAGNRARFHVADLDEPLDFLDDESFDIVLCALVLGSFKDLAHIFTEFHRLLRKPGVLVFSEGHPFHEYMLWIKRPMLFLDVSPQP